MSRRLTLQILAIFVFTASAVLGQNNRSAVSLSGSDMASCTVPDPCRTFDVAISKTNVGGEVVVLSTAGYGPFTVTRSVSIISPPAYHAAMAPTTGTAVTVNAPGGATVILRNLYLNSLGAANGVSINSSTIVHIEGVVVNGFFGNGIEVTGMIGGTAELFVKDAEIRDNNASGIFLGPSSGNAIVSVDHARLERNVYGLTADSGVDLLVRDTVAALNQTENFWFRNSGTLSTLRASVERSTAADNPTFFGGGFVADDGARVTIRDSAAVRNSIGFFARAATSGVTTEMVLDRCLAAENTQQGILAGFLGSGNGLITVLNSTVERNVSNGIVAATNGTVRAFGNTVTKNAFGINGQAGTFRSGGHNFVDGNGTESIGTITPVPTM
jgi:hypothetical protein